MLCPQDGISCNQHHHKSVVLDICPRCSGVWVDGGEFEKLVLHFTVPKLHPGEDILPHLTLAGTGYTPAKDFWREDVLRCPNDDGLMKKHYFAGTTIGLDHCFEC